MKERGGQLSVLWVASSERRAPCAGASSGPRRRRPAGRCRRSRASRACRCVPAAWRGGRWSPWNDGCNDGKRRGEKRDIPTLSMSNKFTKLQQVVADFVVFDVKFQNVMEFSWCSSKSIGTATTPTKDIKIHHLQKLRNVLQKIKPFGELIDWNHNNWIRKHRFSLILS